MTGDIQAFGIEIPQADVDHLHDRLAHARWPGESPGAEWPRGVPVGCLTGLDGYRRTGYDRRAQGARLQRNPRQ